MKLHLVLAASVLTLLSMSALAQHSHHSPKAEPSARAAEAKPQPRRGGFESAFAGYRLFAPDEPARDWKRANEEVRDAGGHVGLMKGESAQLKGHGAHGAKQPTPLSQDKK